MNQSQSFEPVIPQGKCEKPLLFSKFQFAVWCVGLLLIVGAVYGEWVIFQEVNLLKRESISLQTAVEAVIGRVQTSEHKENTVTVTKENQPLVASEDQSNSGWQAYKNEKYGFEMGYPRDWDYEIRDLERLRYFTAYRFADLVVSFYPSDADSAQGLRSPELELVVYSNPERLSGLDFLRMWNDTGAEVIKIDTIGTLTFTYVDLGGMLGSTGVVWQKDGRIFTLTDVNNAYQDGIFSEVLSTFTWKW